MKEDAQQLQIVKQPEKKSLAALMAARFELEPQQFLATITKTCFPNGQATNEQLIAFLAVANEHGLNPFTREIYAFPNRAGGIQPIVGIDGWMKLINNHPQFDGLEFIDHLQGEGPKLYAVTCKIYRKDRQHPTEVTEYMDECYRPTEPWNKMPKRMLRHKAVMQAGRYAFGFAGIQDEDEAKDAISAEVGPALATAAATENKTAILKEEITDRMNSMRGKIGKAKEAKAQESKEPSVPQEPMPPIGEPPASEPPEPPTQEALYSEPPEPKKEDRVITREEQRELVGILEGKKATRSLVLAKLKEKGYERSTEIRLSDYAYFYDWAQSLPEPKSA